MCKMLNIYYQIKVENQTMPTKKVTRKEEPLKLNLAKPKKWKALHVLLVCVNENFKNQSLIDVQQIQEAFIISEKVNRIVKQTRTF